VIDPSGRVVSAGAISSGVLAGLQDGKFQIRQRPGAKNALGGVKFMLPNPNDVYLHDTPSRQLFSRTRRDFSHGCIRLERAVDLAVWVLRDRPAWTRGRIQAAMTAGGPPLQVNLSHPIPVLIVYQTAVAGDDGLAYFFDDIYGQDDVLDQQLISPGSGRLTS
jgi:murein L,D-transpeptidase YcbB/YkuD